MNKIILNGAIHRNVGTRLVPGRAEATCHVDSDGPYIVFRYSEQTLQLFMGGSICMEMDNYHEF
jgi:hypothetical protein